MAFGDSLPLNFDLNQDFFRVFNFKEGPILGCGMSGEVVLGTSRDDPEVIRAVKKFGLFGDNADSSGQRKEAWHKRMFIREVQVMRKVKHPNLMTLVSAIRCPTYLALVMPYYEGGTLSKVYKYLDQDQVNKYFRQLTLAVEYLHLKLIIHGDIKTGNVLISSDDNIVLTDFGLSRILPNKDVTIWVDVGTKAFRAPETFEDERVNPYKADIYSLGVTFWTMVLKRKAYHWVDYLKVLKRTPKKIDHSHRHILRRLLDPNPDLRPQPAEILEEL